jgi:hypothetical protein
LQDPLRNILESYRVMAHYPLTFRQIFEGKSEWSDFMPWYYLLKSMAITIPIIVLSGFLLFFVFSKRILAGKDKLNYLFLLFTVIFPVLFVIVEKSNLYSSWRQFLFVYPGIILIASSGFDLLAETIKLRWMRWSIALVAALLIYHPLSFMIKNHPYEYIYYNELTGGLKGAYGNYETDYYFTSQTEASEWLSGYLEKKRPGEKIKVAATYSVSWLFRKHPEILTSWIRFEERSMTDWDYAIIVNRYIPPNQLKEGIWPPKDAIKVIYADKMPICAVIERKSTDDLLGYEALQTGRLSEAVQFFSDAVKDNDTDEMIFYNFGAALYKNGNKAEGEKALKKCLELNPEFELAILYLGNIARSEGRMDEAAAYYEKVIAANRKYYEAYVSLAELKMGKDTKGARKLLRECLTLNPRYKAAIIALGDTYRESDPGIARRYYEQAKKVN